MVTSHNRSSDVEGRPGVISRIGASGGVLTTVTAVEVTDPATTHRGDDLCEEERRIDEQLRRIHSRLEDVTRTSAPGRPRGVDESTCIGDARTTRAAILHWSVDARMLITDLAQWLTEAHYRDRGTPGG